MCSGAVRRLTSFLAFVWWLLIRILVVGIIAAILGGAGYAYYIYSTSVHFADPMLETALRGQMDFPEGRITLEEARKWGTFDLSGANILNLGGLECFTSLAELNLNGNQIADIGPLEQLKRLTNLSLENNQIADIEPLRTLQYLHELRLQGNWITDIEPLAALWELETLQLSDNPDLWNLEPGCQRVQMLSVRGCSLQDLDALGAFPSLTSLDAGKNNLRSMVGLSACPKLAMAYLDDNHIDELSETVSSPNLVILNLNNNAIENVNAFPTLRSLEQLELAGNQIHQLPDISPLPALRQLNLDDNPLSDAICQGAAYYRSKGITIDANRCPEISAVKIPELPESPPAEMPAWMRRQLESIEKGRQRSMTPGYNRRATTPAELKRYYDPKGITIPIPSRER